MISIYLVDPNPNYPQFDNQIWTFLYWPGTAIPFGRRFGEWSWVGRVENKNKIKIKNLENKKIGGGGPKI